jgi:tyrosyl-tRNA synthetase
MSKSKGNYVGIQEPPGEIFGKLMSISDTLMWRYFELLSFRPMQEISALRRECGEGRNPRDAKVMLAQEIVERFHDRAAAERALADFEARFREGAIPADLPEVLLSGAPLPVGTALREAGLASSSSEALRSIEQGGVKIDGERIGDRGLKLPAGTYVIQVGKRRFARVSIRA